MEDETIIMKEIARELALQINAYGIQDHNLTEWMIIIGKEYGEACRAILQANPHNYRKELIQIAASAIAAIENFDRKTIIYYQPVYNCKLWEEKGFNSFNVYHSKEIAQQDFPTLEIIAYCGHQIEEPIYMDEPSTEEKEKKDNG